MVDTHQRQGRNRLKVAGGSLLLLATLMFVGTFVAVAKMPSYDVSTCKPTLGACDPSSNSSNRQRVFFLGIGATLIVFTGGVVLWSVGNSDAS
jgi:hypothetical protein